MAQLFRQLDRIVLELLLIEVARNDVQLNPEKFAIGMQHLFCF